jgi:BirA family biotin operon repressor/biotin-[acetyl-CoA-carboxylase] ligase
MKRVLFNELDLKSRLSTWIKHVIIFETIDSTNRWLKDHYDSLDSHTLVIAKHQSQGVGRFQRRFHSAKGKGLYVSLLLKDEDVCDFMALCAPVALVHTIQSTLNVKASIKWPNDIYIDDLKVAGILIEAQSSSVGADQMMVVGIGLNVYQQRFPKALKHTAGTLDMFTNQSIDASEIICALIEQLYQSMNDKAKVLDVYRKHLYKVHQVVRIEQKERSYLAEIIDISNEGYLLVKSMDGRIHTLISTDLHIDTHPNVSN